MTGLELQQWLGAHGHPLVLDGKPGAQTRAAILAAFTNTCAEAVTDSDISVIATRLGCSTHQVKAVSIVESGGKAFDAQGRPKMLFERHLFHRMTDGRFTPATFSQRVGGGYDESSWNKLAYAACKDADAAFKAVSWGKFQVLGMHWDFLGYPSVIDMAFSTVVSEAAHYDMLARYIEKNNLKDEVKQLSTNPEDNRAFAKAYNGAAYEKFDYHNKLARAMR